LGGDKIKPCNDIQRKRLLDNSPTNQLAISQDAE